MSTDYELINKDGSLEITEHSNLFDVTIYTGTGDICDLSLEDLKKMNQELTNIISYFDSDYEGCEVDY